MPAKKYANVNDLDAVNSRIEALTQLVEKLVTQPATPSIPANGNHVTLAVNGEPYAITGLHPNTLTYRTATALNALKVGDSVDVPVRANSFRKRLNRLMAGDLTNGGQTFRYEWDEKNSRAVWTELPQFGTHVFTMSRLKNQQRTISRAQ